MRKIQLYVSCFKVQLNLLTIFNYIYINETIFIFKLIWKFTLITSKLFNYFSYINFVVFNNFCKINRSNLIIFYYQLKFLIFNVFRFNYYCCYRCYFILVVMKEYHLNFKILIKKNRIVTNSSWDLSRNLDKFRQLTRSRSWQ